MGRCNLEQAMRPRGCLLTTQFYRMIPFMRLIVLSFGFIVAAGLSGCVRQPCPSCPHLRAKPAAPPRYVEQPPPRCRRVPEAWQSLQTWEKHGVIPRWALKAMPTHNQYVRRVTRVCATVAETRTGKCLRKPRDMANGFPLMPGERISVLGKKPIKGLWPAVRFTKGGVVPGFLLAKDAADKPDLRHRLRFLATVKAAKIRVVEGMDSTILRPWLRARKKKRLLLTGLVYRREMLGCILTNAGVECALAIEGQAIHIGRYAVRMDRPGAPTGWPLMRMQYVTYFQGDKLDLLVRADGKGHFTILAMVDRFGVWKRPGALKK